MAVPGSSIMRNIRRWESPLSSHAPFYKSNSLRSARTAGASRTETAPATAAPNCRDSRHPSTPGAARSRPSPPAWPLPTPARGRAERGPADGPAASLRPSISLDAPPQRPHPREGAASPPQWCGPITTPPARARRRVRRRDGGRPNRRARRRRAPPRSCRSPTPCAPAPTSSSPPSRPRTRRCEASPAARRISRHERRRRPDCRVQRGRAVEPMRIPPKWHQPPGPPESNDSVPGPRSLAARPKPAARSNPAARRHRAARGEPPRRECRDMTQETSNYSPRPEPPARTAAVHHCSDA